MPDEPIEPPDNWETADAGKRLEMLREDIKRIAAVQNGLAEALRALERRVDGLARALAELRESGQKKT
jgi:hypothetical protein